MAKAVKISTRVVEKLLNKHKVTRDEVVECFLNRSGPTFRDTRENHETDPPTQWFCAETDRGRLLKVVFVDHGSFFAVKSAFEPRDGSDKLYAKLCAKAAK